MYCWCQCPHLCREAPQPLGWGRFDILADLRWVEHGAVGRARTVIVVVSHPQVKVRSCDSFRGSGKFTWLRLQSQNNGRLLFVDCTSSLTDWVHESYIYLGSQLMYVRRIWNCRVLCGFHESFSGKGAPVLFTDIRVMPKAKEDQQQT